MSNPQGWASKPSSLRPRTVDKESTGSDAALRGATSAFSPRTSAPSIVISSTAANARLAAHAAGTSAKRRELSKSPERTKRHLIPSPSRGRRSYSDNDLTVILPTQSVLYSPSGAESRLQPPKPIHSTLAARLASERPRSRVGNAIRTPRSIDTTIGEEEKDDQERARSPDAIAGATSSMATQAMAEARQAVPTQLVAKRVLNFEKIPVFTQPRVLPSPETPSESRKPVNKFHRGHESPIDEQRRPSDTPSYSSDRVYRANLDQRIALQLSPQPTGESVALSANVTGTSYDKSKEPLHRGRSPASRKGSDFKSSPMNHASKPKTISQHDFRDAMTVNALADAMVASSLASSRAVSPLKKPPPPPIPRRRSRSLAALPDLQWIGQPMSVRPSKRPPRPMKHTLRKQVQSDDEETELAKRGRRHWMRKHPNVHSEGDRKRWRDKVTERERKRYEGVFAANRGLLIGPGYFEPSASALSDNSVEGNNVVNVVVRDIWERSRLPRDVLKEVYDLVAPDDSHALNREQFVVGLWLIDQRLKGRKLPVKVSTSVWTSVRHPQGIKIKGRHV